MATYESRHMLGHHINMLGFHGIPTFGVPYMPSDKFCPVKQVIPVENASWDLAMSWITSTWHESQVVYVKQGEAEVRKVLPYLERAVFS